MSSVVVASMCALGAGGGGGGGGAAGARFWLRSRPSAFATHVWQMALQHVVHVATLLRFPLPLFQNTVSQPVVAQRSCCLTCAGVTRRLLSIVLHCAHCAFVRVAPGGSVGSGGCSLACGG